MTQPSICYQNGAYVVRPFTDTAGVTLYRIYFRDRFVFSTVSAEKAHTWIITRRTLELRAETITRLVEDEPGMGHERDMRPEAEARAVEEAKRS